MKGIVREVVSTLLLALVFYLVLHLSIQTFQVIGYSMRPSLQDGQRLVANKIIYLFRDPRRGEIVILKRPYGPDYVKRVVAVPDDTVEIRQGKLLLNGVAVEEPYILETPRYSLAPQVIGPGHYFVLGDNRNNSNDSHLFGPIAKKDIVGFAWISIWPPKKWGLAPNYSLAPPGESSALNRAAAHLSWRFDKGGFTPKELPPCHPEPRQVGAKGLGVAGPIGATLTPPRDSSSSFFGRTPQNDI